MVRNLLQKTKALMVYWTVYIGDLAYLALIGFNIYNVFFWQVYDTYCVNDYVDKQDILDLLRFVWTTVVSLQCQMVKYGL